MKKRIVSCLLMLCLLLTACGGTSGQEFDDLQPMPGFDAQNQYSLLGGMFAFQETDTFFCGGGSQTNYLQYYDKASGISGVLCADPACGHDTNACSAYVGLTGASLSWYDGALYWVAKSGDTSDKDDYLWRDDLSGAGREKIKRISFEDISLVYQPQQYMIHRGRLYILGRANAVTDTGTGHRITLLSAPLDDFEEFTVLYDQTFDASEPTVRFVGNSIYLSLFSWHWDEEDVFEGMVTITRIDATTGESEVIYEEAGFTESVSGLWVTAQGEIYLPMDGDDYGGSVWKIEDGKRTKIISWEENDSYVKLMDGIAANFTSEKLESGDRIRYVDIKNYAGETLYSGELFPEGIPEFPTAPGNFSFAVVGGAAEKIVFSMSDFLDGVHTVYMVMVDLSDMKPTILWSSKE